jgi:hypothetical protein
LAEKLFFYFALFELKLLNVLKHWAHGLLGVQAQARGRKACMKRSWRWRLNGL